MKKQGRYSNGFKGEVLRMAETTDQSLSELEQGRAVTGLIRKWRQRCQVGPVERGLKRFAVRREVGYRSTGIGPDRAVVTSLELAQKQAQAIITTTS